MKQNNLCILPWVHLATNSSGHYRLCCNSTPGKNLIINDKTNTPYTPHKIYSSNIEEVWNSNTYKKIRQQFLNNEKPDICIRCFREEDAGLKSARQGWNEKYISNLVESIEPELNIKYIDLRLGNLCNLRCNMCNPYASNQWLKDWHINNDPLPETEYKRLQKMDWPLQEETWSNLIPILPSVETIYLTGGEPTLAKQQYRLYDICIEQGYAKNIILKYNSNLTNLPDKLIKYWKHFKKIKMNASIDGIGIVNDYIRYPSIWNNIEKKLLKLISMEVDLQIHTTVSAYNIFHLPKIFDYFSKYEIQPYLNILNHPEWMNIRILSAKDKYEVKNLLQPYIKFPKVEGLIDYINDDWHHLHETFVKKTQALDKHRKIFYNEIREKW